MFPLSLPLKWIAGGLLALFLGLLAYFSVHTYTTTVQQNGQLQATNVTLQADSAKASSAAVVAVKKLQQFDVIVQQKAKNEQHIQQDNAAFHHELHKAAGQVPAGDAWLAESVPASIVSSLCERTAIRSSDCHRDPDSTNPSGPDQSH